MPLIRAIYKLFALLSFCPTSIILKYKLEQGSLKKVASIQKNFQWALITRYSVVQIVGRQKSHDSMSITSDGNISR